MENRDVDTLLQALDTAPGWHPNAEHALARLKSGGASRTTRVPWMWAIASASALAFALFALPGRGTCGQSPTDAACRKTTERNYKEAGPVNAAVSVEIYLDYECPPCASLFLNKMPGVTASGKVKVLYRDFPLPSHSHAAEAARYVDAAGEAGFYEAAAEQIFRTQAAWKATGNVDRELSQVLPPAAMEKVRGLLAKQSLSGDSAMAAADQVI